MPTDEERKEFEAEIDRYLKALGRWLAAYKSWRGKWEAIFEISLGFDNRGRVPAHGVVVQVRFPDGFEVVDDVPSLPKRPARPVFERRGGLVDLVRGMGPSIRPLDVPTRLPSITPTIATCRLLVTVADH